MRHRARRRPYSLIRLVSVSILLALFLAFHVNADVMRPSRQRYRERALRAGRRHYRRQFVNGTADATTILAAVENLFTTTTNTNTIVPSADTSNQTPLSGNVNNPQITTGVSTSGLTTTSNSSPAPSSQFSNAANDAAPPSILSASAPTSTNTDPPTTQNPPPQSTSNLSAQTTTGASPQVTSDAGNQVTTTTTSTPDASAQTSSSISTQTSVGTAAIIDQADSNPAPSSSTPPTTQATDVVTTSNSPSSPGTSLPATTGASSTNQADSQVATDTSAPFPDSSTGDPPTSTTSQPQTGQANPPAPATDTVTTPNSPSPSGTTLPATTGASSTNQADSQAATDTNAPFPDSSTGDPPPSTTSQPQTGQANPPAPATDAVTTPNSPSPSGTTLPATTGASSTNEGDSQTATDTNAPSPNSSTDDPPTSTTSQLQTGQANPPAPTTDAVTTPNSPSPSETTLPTTTGASSTNEGDSQTATDTNAPSPDSSTDNPPTSTTSQPETGQANPPAPVTSAGTGTFTQPTGTTPSASNEGPAISELFTQPTETPSSALTDPTQQPTQSAAQLPPTTADSTFNQQVTTSFSPNGANPATGTSTSGLLASAQESFGPQFLTSGTTAQPPTTSSFVYNGLLTTAPVGQDVSGTSVSATGNIIPTDTTTSANPTSLNSWLPAQLITANPTSSSPVTTAADPTSSTPAMETASVPQIITPSDGIPDPPANSTLVTIGFLEPLNYEFVVQNSVTVAQIFQLLPIAGSYALEVSGTDITVRSLGPYPVSQYTATVASVWIPSDLVNTLQVQILTANSQLYDQSNPTAQQLVDLIDPTIPLLGNTNGNANTANSGAPNSDGSPDSSGSAAISGSLDSVQPQDSSSPQGSLPTRIAIGAGAAAAAIGYMTLMFFGAQRFRRQSAQAQMDRRRHSRVSSITGERATSPPFVQSYRSSAASSGRAVRGQNISAPLMTENSLLL